jgi:hypothetical protein
MNDGCNFCVHGVMCFGTFVIMDINVKGGVHVELMS